MLLRQIVAAKRTTLTEHARTRMEQRRLTTADMENALKAGLVQEGEFELGSWRYRVSTPRNFFVVAFRSEAEVVIVTAGRPE